MKPKETLNYSQQVELQEALPHMHVSELKDLLETLKLSTKALRLLIVFS